VDLVDFIEWGVPVGVYGEGFDGEGVFDGEWRGVLREILFEHRSVDTAHEFHDAVIEVRGVIVLRHVGHGGRSRTLRGWRQRRDNVYFKVLNDYKY
jgi:hypothetical protein